MSSAEMSLQNRGVLRGRSLVIVVVVAAAGRVVKAIDVRS
jgi:hypothetical protein